VSGRLYVGVDAGGTRTRAVVARAELAPLGRGAAGPANAATNPLPAVVSAIEEAVDDALEAAGIGRDAVRRLACGVAGIEAAAQKERLTEALEEIYAPARALVTTDAEVALAGAHAGALSAPALVLIAGTGTVVFGRNAAGEAARAGGWGPLIGDEGSGYAVGRGVLSAVAQDIDGRGPATLMRSLLLAQEETRAPEDLLKKLYLEGGRPSDVAGYFPIAVNAAKRGDAVAAALLHAAGEELSRSVVTVVRKLGMERERFPIATVGGVFAAGELVLAPIRARLAEVAPGAALGPPTYAPELGAIRLALDAEERTG